MKKFVITVVTALVAVGTACAGQAQVTWQQPDNYTDIREGNDLRDSFRQGLFSDFELLFSDLAKQLPEGCLLDVTVTNLDLAGEVKRTAHWPVARHPRHQGLVLAWDVLRLQADRWRREAARGWA